MVSLCATAVADPDPMAGGASAGRRNDCALRRRAGLGAAGLCGGPNRGRLVFTLPRDQHRDAPLRAGAGGPRLRRRGVVERRRQPAGPDPSGATDRNRGDSARRTRRRFAALVAIRRRVAAARGRAPLEQGTPGTQRAPAGALELHGWPRTADRRLARRQGARAARRRPPGSAARCGRGADRAGFVWQPRRISRVGRLVDLVRCHHSPITGLVRRAGRARRAGDGSGGRIPPDRQSPHPAVPARMAPDRCHEHGRPSAARDAGVRPAGRARTSVVWHWARGHLPGVSALSRPVVRRGRKRPAIAQHAGPDRG